MQPLCSALSIITGIFCSPFPAWRQVPRQSQTGSEHSCDHALGVGGEQDVSQGFISAGAKRRSAVGSMKSAGDFVIAIDFPWTVLRFGNDARHYEIPRQMDHDLSWSLLIVS